MYYLFNIREEYIALYIHGHGIYIIYILGFVHDLSNMYWIFSYIFKLLYYCLYIKTKYGIRWRKQSFMCFVTKVGHVLTCCTEPKASIVERIGSKDASEQLEMSCESRGELSAREAQSRRAERSWALLVTITNLYNCTNVFLYFRFLLIVLELGTALYVLGNIVISTGCKCWLDMKSKTTIMIDWFIVQTWCHYEVISDISLGQPPTSVGKCTCILRAEHST